MLSNLRLPQKLALLLAVLLGALLVASLYGLHLQRQPSATQDAPLVFGLILLVASALGLWISRSIQMGVLVSVRHAASAARSIADGDLTVDVRVVGKGEMSKMLRALSDMTIHLRELVSEVAASAHTVTDSSVRIAQGNQDLSRRTEEQATTLEETSSALEQLTATVAQNADNARKAAQLAGGATDVARRGGRVVDDVVSTMTRISGASRRIEDIIGVIDGIAFQTNILALNAAVEAARAGEQGRGFAVVAAEVRSLAQRSAAASREIKDLIGDSAAKVEAGSRLVDSAGKTMHEIVAAIEQVTELVSEIAAASAEQSTGIVEVNTAMTQMDRAVQQNASMVGEAASATESLKESAGAMQKLVARFKLGTEPARGRPVQAHPQPQVQVQRNAPRLPAALPAATGEWKEF